MEFLASVWPTPGFLVGVLGVSRWLKIDMFLSSVSLSCPHSPQIFFLFLKICFKDRVRWRDAMLHYCAGRSSADVSRM